MYAIIDIETTGASALNGKITEIAILIHNGTTIIDSFVSLINPECHIPWNITKLTGISNEMVENAPRFYEIAKRIVEITAGTTFVAHNASFDYSFIKEEFKRLGYDYKRKTICTVTLSRRLLPGHRSYSLGKLCNDLGIHIDGRHRANGDAMATAKLFEILLSKNQSNVSGLFAESKSALTQEQLTKIPSKTGIYYFLDEKSKIIYIGKSKDIYHRVLAHLNNNKTKKAIEMRERIRDVDFIETGSELIALLLESDEIKKHKPLYNRAKRRSISNYGLFIFEDSNGYMNLKIDKIKGDEIPLTTFHFLQQGNDYLHQLAEQNRLCKKLCNLENQPNGCFNHQIGKCLGACNGLESNGSYNNRVKKAIQPFNFENLNFFLIEPGRNQDEISVVKVQNGRYVGFGYAIDNMTHTEQLNDCIKLYNHNRDTFNIIKQYLLKSTNHLQKITY